MTDYRTNPAYKALVATCGEKFLCDTPRLVLADWLDENGGELQAAFIRGQVEAAKNTGSWTIRYERPNQWHPIELRDLIAYRPWEHFPGDAPTVFVVKGLTGHSRCVAYHRGFPAVVGCTPRNWHRHHDLFKVPVVVCAADSSPCGVWGVDADTLHDPERVYVSMTSPGIVARVRRNPGEVVTEEGIYKAAFPNVYAYRATPCTRELLDEVCAEGGIGCVEKPEVAHVWF